MTKLSRDELLRFPIGKAVKTYTLVSSNGDCQTDHGALIPLGSGGSGVVYRAIQTLHADATIHRAVKFFLYADPIAELTAHRYSGPVSAADFLAEIANIISFNHEHLLRVIDAGIADVDGVDIPFLVTEFIEGPTLRDLVDNLANGNAATGRVRADLQDHPTLGLEILLRVALGLAHIHQRGFAHCDIAPKNIFLSVEGTYRPVIGDLGIAKNLRRERHEVLLAGSKRYSPPDVVDRLNLVIPWSEFLSYQPRWDIVGFGKTGKEFLSLVLPDRLPQWYRPLLAMLEDCCEYRTYLSVEQVVAYLQFLQPVHRETAAVRELSTSLQGVTRRLIPVEPVLVTDRFRPLTYHPALLRLALENVRQYLLALIDRSEFLEHLNVAKIETALLAALLVNITRFPLSNIVHEIKGRHEPRLTALSRRELLAQVFSITDGTGRTIPDLIEENFPQVHTEPLRNILLGRDITDPRDHFIYSLLNCSLDARVVDFVRRDSMHLGLTKGEPFDIRELMAHLTIHNHQLALRVDGVTIAEQIIALRYWLFKRIYWNRPNRTYCAMLRHVLMELAKDPSFVDRMKDVVLFASEHGIHEFMIQETRKADRPDLTDVMTLLDRESQDLFWVIFDSVPVEDDEIKMAYDGIDRMDHDEMRALARDIKEAVGHLFDKSREEKKRVAVLVDIPYERNFNKLGYDILVRRRGNTVTNLARMSGMIRGINHSFDEELRRLRVMVHPELAPRDRAKRRDLTNQIRTCLLNRTFSS